MLKGGANADDETHSDLSPFHFDYTCLFVIRVRCRPDGNTAISMAVVACDALAWLLVDLSADVFRFYDCDVYLHDEKWRHGLHVARPHDG